MNHKIYGPESQACPYFLRIKGTTKVVTNPISWTTSHTVINKASQFSTSTDSIQRKKES